MFDPFSSLILILFPAPLHQTLWATAFMATKKQGVKGLEEVFWGIRQCVQASSEEREKVFCNGTYGNGLVRGGAVLVSETQEP
jgi:hypothetical protein